MSRAFGRNIIFLRSLHYYYTFYFYSGRVRFNYLFGSVCVRIETCRYTRTRHIIRILLLYIIQFYIVGICYTVWRNGGASGGRCGRVSGYKASAR